MGSAGGFFVAVARLARALGVMPNWTRTLRTFSHALFITPTAGCWMTLPLSVVLRNRVSVWAASSRILAGEDVIRQRSDQQGQGDLVEPREELVLLEDRRDSLSSTSARPFTHVGTRGDSAAGVTSPAAAIRAVGAEAFLHGRRHRFWPAFAHFCP